MRSSRACRRPRRTSASACSEAESADREGFRSATGTVRGSGVDSGDVMKWCRYGEAGSERLGCVDAAGVLRDASSLGGADEVVALAAGSPPDAEAVAALPAVGGTPRYGACVPRPGKILCIGLNYSDHAEEAGMAVPDEPILFFKAAEHRGRPRRRHPPAPRRRQDRLGGGAGRGDRPRSPLRGDRRGGPHPRRRLLRQPRRLGTRLSAGARRPVVQGQELRHLQPAGPVAGDARRGRPTWQLSR